MLVRKIFRNIYSRFFNKYSVKKYIKNGMIVGKNFCMLDGGILDFAHAWHIEIGDDVTLAPRVVILAHDASTKMHLNYTRIAKVRIGNRVFVGACSIILPGVRIGDDVVIGAGSVVTHNVPDRSVAAGNPARVICSFDDFLSKRRFEMTKCPVFGFEYTINSGVTDNMKKEMNNKMSDGIGYIV